MLKNSVLAEKAFIKPVRSVLFVDDQFPTYEELAGAERPKRNEIERAGRLVSSCRIRHYVCDVRNNPDALNNVEMEKIGVSDLLVIDYHLRGDAGNREDALNFLARLARSPHFNLAVIYTGEKNLTSVRQAVATRIRGKPPLADPGVADLPEVSVDLTAVASNLDAYIAGDPCLLGGMKVLFPKDKETVAHLDKRSKWALLRRFFEAFLEEKFGKNADNVPAELVPVAMSAGGESGHWVQGGNLFVVVVPKGQPGDIANDDIGALLQKLVTAIVDWSPSLIEVMMASAAGSIVRHGLRKSAIDFADEMLCSGLVYWFLAGDSAYGDVGQVQSDADRRTRIEELHQAIFHLLCAAALEEAANLSEEIIRDKLGGQNPIEVPAEQRMTLVKDWSKAKGIDENKMKLAANAFLCSARFTAKHVTTGTIFQEVGKDDYWLCVSAACDMVPRGPSANNQWRAGLYPYRMMMAARLEKWSSPAGALADAHFGKNIFIKIDQDLIALKFIPPGLSEPSVAPMFAENKAMVVEGKFRGILLNKSPEDTLVLNGADYRPIAQLKPEYASRLLQQTGHHLSRIGVDFLGTRSAGAAKEGAAPPQGAA
ncbi:MAG TPA: response regulator receiver domain [Opitutaceae bacterium]|nr:response regulator receiver domain [Opitutaceae bacterium]